MSDQTINPVFAPIIKNAFYNLEYIIFKEKINSGMLCQVNTANSFGGWDRMGWGGESVWRRLSSEKEIWNLKVQKL